MEIIPSVIGGVRQRGGWANRFPIPTLPVYLSFMLLITSIISVGVVGLTGMLRLNVQPPDPFAPYADIFPGQPQSAVVTRGFSCQLSPEYCTSEPVDGPFFLVAVTLANGVVRRLDFAMRQNRLVMGDLPLDWGRPQIKIYQESVSLNWTTLGVSGNGWAKSRYFSYFMPLVRISLAGSKIAR